MIVRAQLRPPAKSSRTRSALGRAACGFACSALLLAGCKKPLPPHTVGIALDVGGRGDQSFNDGALRGVEGLAAGVKSTASGYKALSDAEYAALVPSDLSPVAHLPIPPPLVLSGKAQEDYEPNLQLLVDQGTEMVIAVGFMMEPAVRAVSLRNPNAKFLLLDSPVLDDAGKKPVVRPNVRAVVFREQESSFLCGMAAALVSKTGKVGFVGGMDIPLIRKFALGYVSGVHHVNPADEVFQNMTGTTPSAWANPTQGAELARSQFGRGADVVFHAAGATGLGVMQAAADAGLLSIGCDSNQDYLHPGSVLTSAVKRVDVAVYTTFTQVRDGTWHPGLRTLGLAEQGVDYSLDENNRTVLTPAIEKALNEAKAAIIAGRISVPEYRSP